MNAGRLDQRITLEAPTVTTDELGQDARSWELQGHVWAEVKEQMGREFLAGDYHAEEKVAFRIRWRELDSTWRVTWGDRIYRIVSTTGTRRSGERWLHCMATDGTN